MTRTEQIQQQRYERFDRKETDQMKEILRKYLSKNNIEIIKEEFERFGESKSFKCETNNGEYRIINVIGYRNRGIHMQSYFAMYKEENGKSKRIPKKEW